MFDPEKFVATTIQDLRAKIAGRAIIACSGGVDSTVAAVLVSKAIRENLLTVFVDTGMLRKNEPENVRKMLDKLGLNSIVIDAQDDFFKNLKGVTDPEKKRKVIGERFIRVFESVAEKYNAEYLVQGTIAPDWIESGGELRDNIKSHHNVGGLPKDMKLKLVEPLRDIYKDEVRKVARYLGVEIAERQPFPGPGLGVRIIGEVTPLKTHILKEADNIATEEIEKAVTENKMERPWQYFTVLLNDKTVGVHGDLRAYGYIVSIRSVKSVDGMSAEYSKIPHDVLERISVRITNQLKEVNRVVYDITNKPPGTIEWE
jgi:GMP synthase (glutamine-hydrolysing)